MKIKKTIVILFMALFAVTSLAVAEEVQKEKTKEEIEKEKLEKRAKAVAFAESGIVQQIQTVNNANTAASVSSNTSKTEGALKASRQYRSY